MSSLLRGCLNRGGICKIKNVFDFSPGGIGPRIGYDGLVSTQAFRNPPAQGSQWMTTSCSQTDHQFAVQDDLQLAFLCYERGNDVSSKSPIILLHGLLGRKENWGTVGKELNHLTHRNIVIPDARNHGDSPPSHEMSHKSMAGDIFRLMGQLSIKKASLVGHGLGGRHAMYLALSKPSLVEKLVVVSTSPLNNKVSEAAHDQVRQACYVIQTLANTNQDGKAKAELISSLDFKLEADSALKEVLPDKRMRALLISNLGHVNHTAILANPDLGRFPSFSSAFDKPVLFVSGEKSPSWSTEEEVRKIQELFPNANFAKISKANRFPSLENHQEFMEVTSTFLQS